MLFQWEFWFLYDFCAVEADTYNHKIICIHISVFIKISFIFSLHLRYLFAEYIVASFHACLLDTVSEKISGSFYVDK